METMKKNRSYATVIQWNLMALKNAVTNFNPPHPTWGKKINIA
jgi:hypothetical protein